MQDADTGTVPTLDGEGLHVGIVRARFNDEITRAMQATCAAELQALGVAERHVTTVEVPGALEIPFALKLLADSDEFDALVALGCVIRGETYHFELVADQSAAGVMQVMLEQQIPIANAILTVENEAQARARMHDKARDAARVAVEMANLREDY